METGRYLTSFLEITVDSDEVIDNIAQLSHANLGTYYHEYIHYLQDVTTCSGLCKIWRAFDCVRQLVSSIQPDDIKDVAIPLDNAMAREQLQHLDFLEDLRGSGQISGISMQVADTYKIFEVIEEPNERIAQYYATSTATAIKLHLESAEPGTTPKRFTFGEYAVSETMAYLIEKKFFPDLQLLPRYPYKVAADLVHHLYPGLTVSDVMIFAICDAALLYNMPGWAFVKIVQSMAEVNYQPSHGHEVIDFSYNFYRAIKWDHIEYSRAAVESIHHIANALYGHEFYTNSKELLQASVERGRIAREQNPYFLVSIFDCDEALSFDFYKTFNFIGGLSSVNGKGQCWVRVPNGLERLQAGADPLHFRIALQMSKFILEGQRPCSLTKNCEAHTNRTVDDRCLDRPWKWAADGQGCPYAAAWSLYGFKKKNFYLHGVMIQQAEDD
jgi:hypothetical protein